jgi:magnesium transporter
MCLLFAKSGVELLLLTFTTPHNQFTHWQSWLLLLGLVGFALLQLWYLHKSLVLADPTLVCPLAFCFYNLSSIFNGLVYYDQFALMSPLKLGMVGLGIVVLLAGVWAVSVQGGNDEEGGTRVEVGTWTEGAEVLTSELVGVESAAVTGGIVEPQPPPPPPTVILTGASDSRRGTGLLLSTENLDVDSDLEREESVSPLRRSIVVSSPLGSPSALGGGVGGPTPFPLVRSPTSGTGRHADLGHGRDPSARHHHHHHRRMWSAIFEGQGGVAPGLSIGLGATSPGFALVPRRRVSSGISGGGGEVSTGVVRRRTNTSVGDVEGGGRGRRTVSEGDFGRLRDGEGRPLLGGGDHGGGGGEAGSGSGANSRGGEVVPRRGWDWVRTVFRL